MNVIGRLLAINLRENLQHKVRGSVGVTVVAVSIALVVGVFATYGSITGSVNELSQRIAGSADLEVSGIADTGFTPSNRLRAICRGPSMRKFPTRKCWRTRWSWALSLPSMWEATSRSLAGPSKWNRHCTVDVHMRLMGAILLSLRFALRKRLRGAPAPSIQ